MSKNVKYEITFGANPTDFFENYIACRLRCKECSETLWIIFIYKEFIVV